MKKTPKRCLIEIDGGIYTDYGGQFEDTQERLLAGQSVESFWPLIVVGAMDKKEQVWYAIQKSDEIWLDSSLIGDSGRLLVEMMKMAVQHGITGKKLINMREWTDVMWHIPDEARELMKELREKSKIKFIFKDSADFKKHLPKPLK